MVGVGVTRYLEVPMQHEGPASEVDSHRCSRGELCASLEPKPLGWCLREDDDTPYYGSWWEYPFVPAGADPLDTSLWVCEDCACELEEL